MTFAELIAAKRARLENEAAELDVLLAIEARIRQLETLPPAPAPAPAPVIVPTPAPAALLWAADWTKSLAENGFVEEAKVPGRAKTNWVLGSRPTLRLHTEPGDNNVAGSGASERNDVYQSRLNSTAPLYFFSGDEHVLVAEVFLPADYVVPPTDRGFTRSWNNLLSYHYDPRLGNASETPFSLRIESDLNDPLNVAGEPPKNPRLRLIGHGWRADAGRPRLLQWMQLVLRVRFSYESDGVVDAWLDWQRVVTHRGPTLAAGQRCYLKLANYHTAHGKASSEHFGRVQRARNLTDLGFRLDGQNLI